MVWGLVVAAALVALSGRRRIVDLASIMVVIGVLAVLSFAPLTHWSPYQRITTSPRDADGIAIDVNGRPHQRIMSVSYMETEQAFRFEPYARSPENPLRNVLIVGAGSGNDVAIALAQGADHVDAVEIDPVLYALGRDLHPDRPYEDPRVDVYVEDGRAFIHDTDTMYDLVIFAIPDSLAALAGQSSLRLESFLSTEEAVGEVRDHLAPGGAVAMYHYYLPVALDRYGDILDRTFGAPPCLDLSPGPGERPRTVLTASNDPASLVCGDVWERPAAEIVPETDDFPFPYLVGRGTPALLSAGAAADPGRFAHRRSVRGGPLHEMRSYVDLFFMGAAFLLLETTNVVRFALWFGTTWFVNALVFGGILVSVWLAVEVTRRWPVRRPSLLYAPLFVSLAIAWAVPIHALLDLRARGAVRRRGHARLHAGVHRQPDLRQPVQGRRLLDDRLRHEPAGGDRGRRPRVRRARRGISVAVDRRRGALRHGARHGPYAPRSSVRHGRTTFERPSGDGADADLTLGVCRACIRPGKLNVRI